MNWLLGLSVVFTIIFIIYTLKIIYDLLEFSSCVIDHLEQIDAEINKMDVRLNYIDYECKKSDKTLDYVCSAISDIRTGIDRRTPFDRGEDV